MQLLDFSNVKLIDKYYREKFTFDVSLYVQQRSMNENYKNK